MGVSMWGSMQTADPPPPVHPLIPFGIVFRVFFAVTSLNTEILGGGVWEGGIWGGGFAELMPV